MASGKRSRVPFHCANHRVIDTYYRITSLRFTQNSEIWMPSPHPNQHAILSIYFDDGDCNISHPATHVSFYANYVVINSTVFHMQNDADIDAAVTYADHVTRGTKRIRYDTASVQLT
jgi:hypothetical protein